jgi:hypothetical protein
MDIPIMSHAELRQWLSLAFDFSRPEDVARHVMGIAQALQLDTAALMTGRGLMGIAEHIAAVLQIELHGLNGGW